MMSLFGRTRKPLAPPKDRLKELVDVSDLIEKRERYVLKQILELEDKLQKCSVHPKPNNLTTKRLSWLLHQLNKLILAKQKMELTIMMLEGAQVGFGTGIATAPRVHFFNPPNDQCCESVGDTSNGFHEPKALLLADKIGIPYDVHEFVTAKTKILLQNFEAHADLYEPPETDSLSI